MKKISDFIIKYRLIFAAVFIMAAIVFLFFIPKINVNYDMKKYLKNDSDTIIAINKTNEEFGAFGTASVLVENVSKIEANDVKHILEEIDGITLVSFDPDNKNYYNEDKNLALFSLMLNSGNYDEKTDTIISEIKDVLKNYSIYLTGGNTEMAYISEALSTDMLIILIVAAAIILLILTLTSNSWIDPLIFFIILIVAIILNLGTNALLPSVSFVTNSICIVLQLALAMDYSIMLLHRFLEEREKGVNPKEAASNALSKSFVSIFGSSFTTIAGLAALMFMKFTIGFDIGLVLIKGIIFSLLSVFLLMPSILVLFSNLIEKTKHRSIHSIVKGKIAKNRAKKAEKQKIYNEANHDKNLKKIRTFSGFQMATRFIVPIVLVLIIGAGAFLNSRLNYSFTLDMSKDKSSSVIVGSELIKENFGNQNPLVVMVPKGDREKEKELFNKIKFIKTDGKQIIEGGQAIVMPIHELGNLSLSDTITAADLSAMFNIPIILLTPIFINLGLNNGATVYEFLEKASGDAVVKLVGPLGDSFQQQINDAYILANQAFNMLESENYTRMIFNIKAAVDSDEAFDTVDKVKKTLSDYYSESYILSESANFLEIKNNFLVDNNLINLLSFFAIFLIILISFRSLSIPVILTVLIQGSIWITGAFSVISGSSIYFLCYLMLMCIQMGATVDYAILFTSRYKEARTFMNRQDSAAEAFDKSIMTILTSGLILVIAAFLVGMVCRIPIISQLGLILSQGCLTSLILIVFALPQTLILFDKVIEKTSLKTKLLSEPKPPKKQKSNNK